MMPVEEVVSPYCNATPLPSVAESMLVIGVLSGL